MGYLGTDEPGGGVEATRGKVRLEGLDKHSHHIFSMPRDKNPQQNGRKNFVSVGHMTWLYIVGIIGWTGKEVQP